MKVKIFTVLALSAALFLSACGKSDADLEKAATEKLKADNVAGFAVTQRAEAEPTIGRGANREWSTGSGIKTLRLSGSAIDDERAAARYRYVFQNIKRRWQSDRGAGAIDRVETTSVFDLAIDDTKRCRRADEQIIDAIRIDVDLRRASE